METHLTIIAKLVTVPGPQGTQAGLQIMFQAEGAQAADPAFLLLMLEQAKGAIYQQVVQGAAPRVVIPGGPVS